MTSTEVFNIVEDESNSKACFELEEANSILYSIIDSCTDIEETRDKVYSYLESLEKNLRFRNSICALEKASALQSIFAFKRIISPYNENRTGHSALAYLIEVINGSSCDASFLGEFIALFKGIAGNSNIYGPKPDFIRMKGRQSALARSDFLDSMDLTHKVTRFRTGLSQHAIKRRAQNKERILQYFRANDKQWDDWSWHLRNIIRDAGILKDLTRLSEKENEAVRVAVANRIPFGITPYYLSLMDSDGEHDTAVRKQVIPSLAYVNNMIQNNRTDFMKEGDTSPVDLVTRRYPQIAILKPYNTCPQICVYCQRNWEIKDVLAGDALASDKKIEEAIGWFRDHESIQEVLVTGGDPALLSDKKFDWILSKLSAIPHIRRIRIATRMLVTLPQRITEEWVSILRKYHVPGKREIYVVTHVEHVYEITPELKAAAQRLRKNGLTVYNQHVYTSYVSRRFEAVALRFALKSVGIDPYYTFFPKGKKEARDYLIPLARILQERKEEARLLPGSVRTDEPVFNVPGLGKNHLRAMQDHELIMIKPNGARIYEMHPWEKNINNVDTYIYEDIPIAEYLDTLRKRGENLEDYRTIWYYY